MSKRMWLAPAGAMVLACSVVAGSASAGESGRSVRYHGDRTAQAVCMSIVHDSVRQLDRALKQSGNYYDARNAHLSYRCNDLALNEFAFSQSAVEVGAYLAPLYGDGTVTIEQVSSIND